MNENTASDARAMSAVIGCPPWCTEHSIDVDECVSVSIGVGSSCGVWLLGEGPGIEPVIIVDAQPFGGELTLLEASELQSAIATLREAATKDTPVRR